MAWGRASIASDLMKTEGETENNKSARGDDDCGDSSCNDLDHVTLVHRRKLLLLSRKPPSLSADARLHIDVVVKSEDEQCLAELDSGGVDQDLQNATGCQGLGMAEDFNCQGTGVIASFYSDQKMCSETNAVGLETSTLGDGTDGSDGTCKQALMLNSNIYNDFGDSLDHIVLKERQRMLLSRKSLRLAKQYPEVMPMELYSCDGPDSVPESLKSMSMSAPLNFVKVKAEQLDNSDSCNADWSGMGNLSVNIVTVKSEPGIPNELYRDTVVQKLLPAQKKLEVTGNDSESNNVENSKLTRKSTLQAFDHDPTTSDSVSINRQRKRKKTATDSVETAMEEDAPGLLQVLVERGISPDEIKLYGGTDNNEPIDESFIEDGFAELEDVMSKGLVYAKILVVEGFYPLFVEFKLFFQRNSLLKLAPLRCTKGSKPTYCLACLFSLVEQTRYLQFRNWPAEWGWCRDLQSFIFVFEKHKRIVLERPEYGYATYFFELLDSSPIKWQIKRLVIAMKLTSCGRISLIENKALMVGDDLTEGEAQVLIQYGWTPNSGLGTMLNYRDRVVHDRKNEKYNSEWRSKIGKMLMDGYNGGTIVSTNMKTKAIEYEEDESRQIKVEPN